MSETIVNLKERMSCIGGTIGDNNSRYSIHGALLESSRIESDECSWLTTTNGRLAVVQHLEVGGIEPNTCQLIPGDIITGRKNGDVYKRNGSGSWSRIDRSGLVPSKPLDESEQRSAFPNVAAILPEMPDGEVVVSISIRADELKAIADAIGREDGDEYESGSIVTLHITRFNKPIAITGRRECIGLLMPVSPSSADLDHWRSIANQYRAHNKAANRGEWDPISFD